jgi:small subunit ribosomal protein S10
MANSDKNVIKSGRGLKIIMSSPDHRLLDFLTSKIKDAALTARINVSIVQLPVEKTIFCCLRSPTIYKDSVDQFKSVVKKRLVLLKSDSSFEVIKNLSIPAGVDVTIKSI